MLEEFFSIIFIDTIGSIGASIRYVFLKLIGKDIRYKDLRQNDQDTGFLNYFVASVFIGILVFLVTILVG